MKKLTKAFIVIEILIFILIVLKLLLMFFDLHMLIELRFRFVFSLPFIAVVQMSRNTVYHDRRHISLDQRAHVVEEFLRHIRSVFVDPFSRNHLLHVGNLVDILKAGGTLVRIVRNPL